MRFPHLLALTLFAAPLRAEEAFRADTSARLDAAEGIQNGVSAGPLPPAPLMPLPLTAPLEVLDVAVPKIPAPATAEHVIKAAPMSPVAATAAQSHAEESDADPSQPESLAIRNDAIFEKTLDGMRDHVLRDFKAVHWQTVAPESDSRPTWRMKLSVADYLSLQKARTIYGVSAALEYVVPAP